MVTKIFKILLSIIGLLIGIALLAAGALVYFVDPNQLKPTLIEEVKNKTGYQLAIQGKLSWSFYPRIAIKIDHLSLSEAANSAQGPFIEASNVKLATDLNTLLHTKEKLQFKISIADLHLLKLHAQALTTDLNWENNVLSLQPIRASLYQGSLYGTLTGRDFSFVPAWEWSMQADGVQMSALLKDLNGDHGDNKLDLSGIGNIKLHAETHGKNHMQLLSSLNGSGEFSVKDGSVKGIDLNYFFQMADALLNNEATTELENKHQTDFASLTGPFQIKNGVVSSNNVLLLSPVFLTSGIGSIDILTRMVDFQLAIKSLGKTRTQWEIPIMLSGSLDRPDIRLDTLKIQRYLASKQIKKAKEKAIEQIKKHVPGKTGEFLQQLLQ